MRKLWGRANSSNVIKVIWLLEELGLPYERIDIGGPFGGTGAPEYRAMNPTGLVPTLQEGDFTLWESNAILRYLCDAHAPSSPLWPRDPKARGEIDHWMDFQQTTLNRPHGVFFLGLIRTKPENRDMVAIGAAIEEAGRAWALLDAQLARHPYVAGDALTLADFTFGPHIHRWFVMAIDRPDLPHLRAWYDRLLTNPHFARHAAIDVT